MRENLSAPGTISEWLQISRQALVNLGYHNVRKDPVYARFTADYGYDETFLINIRSKDYNHVLLEFSVSNPKLIKQFQTASAQVIRQMQAQHRKLQEEKKYGPQPVQPINYHLHRYGQNNKDTVPDYIAEEGDYIERTRLLPDETLTLKEYHEGVDRHQMLTFKEKFELYFNKLWVIWLFLFLFPPFGIFMLWYFHRMRFLPRLLTTVFFTLFFFLVWIGILGIDTGFNREGIQRFYEAQQYRFTRFFNEFDNANGLNSPITEPVPQ